MPNEDKGHVTCTYCATKQPVRKNAKGKYYINCSNCGVIQPALPFFQTWIMDNAKLYGAEGLPEPAPREAPKPKGPEPDRNDAPTVQATPPAASVPAATPKTDDKKPARGFGMFRR